MRYILRVTAKQKKNIQAKPSVCRDKNEVGNSSCPGGGKLLLFSEFQTLDICSRVNMHENIYSHIVCNNKKEPNDHLQDNDTLIVLYSILL